MWIHGSHVHCTGMFIPLYPEGHTQGYTPTAIAQLFPWCFTVGQHLQCTHSPLQSKAPNYPSEASREIENMPPKFSGGKHHVTLLAVLLIFMFHLIEIAACTDWCLSSLSYFHQRNDNNNISGVDIPASSQSFPQLFRLRFVNPSFAACTSHLIILKCRPHHKFMYSANFLFPNLFLPGQ